MLRGDLQNVLGADEGNPVLSEQRRARYHCPLMGGSETSVGQVVRFDSGPTATLFFSLATRHSTPALWNRFCSRCSIVIEDFEPMND